MSLGARAALWLVFAALVAASGILVLRACGTAPILGWSRNFCPIPAQRQALKREIEQGETLRHQVHATEMTLAQLPPCTTPAPPAPPPVDTQALDQKVEERGGRNGQLQFTLSWHTLDDLDINVDCPGGRISSATDHRGPGICGDGVKDLDANRNLTENVSTDPVENVVWDHDIPDGTYSIEIIEYLQHGNDGNTVPFTLRMRYGDQERICNDVVTSTPMGTTQRDGEFIVGGTYRTITWQKGAELPPCNFQIGIAHRGVGKK